ncbi:unnamed protein product [Ophioblennius macclurei]
MDQHEDRDQGVPPSKRTLSGRSDNQSEVQRSKSEGAPSCVSLKSDLSKDDFLNFRGG